MSKRGDDELRFEDIRPGSIDDLFENDDELELEVNETDDVEVNETDDVEISKEEWNEYLIDDDLPTSENNSEETVPETPSETFDVESEVIDEETTLKEEMVETEKSTEDVVSEVETPEITEEIKEVVQENPIEEKLEDNDDEIDDVNTTEQEILENLLDEENTIEETSESTEDVQENLIETIEPETDPQEEVVEESQDKNDDSETVETVTVDASDDDVEVIEEESDNSDSDNGSDDPSYSAFVQKVREEENGFDPSKIKGPEDEAIEHIDPSDLTKFMNSSFKTRVKNVLEKYSEKDLCKFLADAKNAKTKDPDSVDMEMVKDIYTQERVKYAQFVNFKNPNAIHDLWMLVAYEYHNVVTLKDLEENGNWVEPILRDDKTGSGISTPDQTLIEDPGILAIRNQKKENADKWSQYALDRTIFNISDDEEEENSSIFDDKRTLMKDFYESPFYGILKEVMQSDKMANMDKVKCKVTINEQTSYIPVIDFNTGIRVICIDTSDTDQYKLNAMLISRRNQFSYNIPKGSMKVRILYSDNCIKCPVATIAALKKLVAYKFIKNRYKPTLNHNYVTAYTTEGRFIDMFERGDPDSKKAGSSTYASPKPGNMSIGVIVLDKKSEKDRKAVRRNQFRHDSGQDINDMSVENYDIQFILSARIIKNDLRLRDPTYPKNERYVEYTITQYTECNSVIVEDGFQTIIACIIKEHMRTYDPGINYAISFELDRDNLVTPSIIGMIDDHDGLEISQTRRAKNPYEYEYQFILPPSRLKMDGIYPIEKGRLDIRFFSPTSIMHTYQERSLWQNYDINTHQGRNEFIKSRGFEEFWIPARVIFDVMPYVCDIVETGDMFRNIQKVSIMALSDRNSADTDNILFKQRELEYIKSLGGQGNYGGFQKFLFTVLDYLVDSHAERK